MGQHWRPLGALYPEGTVSSGYISEPKTVLSYSRRARQVGFDFNAHGLERFYAFSVCRWLALRVGEQRSILKVDEGERVQFPKPVPFIVYDGSDGEWPVFKTAPKGMSKKVGRGPWVPFEGFKWCEVDHWGVKKETDIIENDDLTLVQLAISRLTEEPLNPMEHRAALNRAVQPELLEARKPIRAELRRLDGLLRAC